MIALALRHWKPIAAVAGVAMIALAIWWLRADAYSDGKRAERAEWQEASAKLVAAAERVRNAADAVAAKREQQNATDMKGLRDAASKGTDVPVGDGVAGVLGELRRQQGR